MVDELRHAFELAQQQPDEEQRRIAQMVLEELEEREWEALTRRPGARAFHEELRAELREAEERGEVEEIHGDKLG